VPKKQRPPDFIDFSSIDQGVSISEYTPFYFHLSALPTGWLHIKAWGEHGIRSFKPNEFFAPFQPKSPSTSSKYFFKKKASFQQSLIKLI
jgi:hypothetical protein